MTDVAILEITAKPGQRDEAVKHLEGVLVSTRAFAGCEGAEILVDHENPDRFVLLERWANAEADAAYRAWRRSGTPDAAFGTLLAGAPVTSKYSLN
ncbi:MAG: hypothetical protein JWO10_1689 [Microbacteriaceae bacterium]|nr:hypothetical protein [Microbacteriaceae bacterium]